MHGSLEKPWKIWGMALISQHGILHAEKTHIRVRMREYINIKKQRTIYK
jgi:hypothetical protein